MKKIVLLPLIASTMFVTSALADNNERSVKLVLDVNPAAFVYMPKLKDFWVDDGIYIEQIDGNNILAPNANIGANFKISDSTSIEATIGAGKLLSDAIEASFTTERLGINFKLDPTFTLGVQAGRISYKKIEWQGQTTVDFSDTKGSLFGISLSATLAEPFSVYGSVERSSVDKIDVTVPPGSSAEPTLDISGTMFNLGIKMMF